MKQKLKRFMAGFMAMLTLVGTLFTNGTTAFAASPQANIAFWNASVKNSGEVSELKPGYNHGKILYSILDGNSAYCMNFGLRADGGQLMNSYDDASTSMSAQQRKLLSYCLYYGFNSTQKAAPSNSQCDEYIATQAMVWVIVADIFGTGSGDSAARKLCNTAPSPDSSYSYYERLRDNISSSYNATLPSFASRRTSEAPTYELKWNEGSQRFETTLSDSNGVLSDFDFGISGYSVDKNGNSITISSTSVNTTATTGTFTSNAGKVETTSSCVFWLTGKSGYQEFISERPTADPIKAYIKVKTENIGYGELTKTDESSGVKLSGAVYGIYSDSGCTNRIQTMTTDGNGYAKSAALVAGTYYVKEITAPSYEEYDNAIKVFLEKNIRIILATGIYDEILYSKHSQKRIEICKGNEIVIDSIVHKNKQEIEVPIISVMGVGYNVSKFDVQLYLREMFLKKGYKVAQIGTKKISNIMGFYSIPDFMYNNRFSGEETILRFNEFVKKVEDKEKPDIIIIGVPEPILPLNKKHLFSFGIRAYEIYQAVDVDYCILNLLSGEYSDQFETEMKNVCKYRYNVDIDDFFVSNFSIVSNSLYSSELKYVYVQMNALPKSKNFFNADDLKDERWFNKIEARLKKYSMFEQF